MSTMSAALAAHHPRWPIPDDLERAWLWMEDQGFGRQTPAGYTLAPYDGDRQLGPVFRSDLTMEGWLEPGAPGHDRLLPIAEAAGDGSIVALWFDDEERTRAVVLGPLGSCVVADDARELLVLLAIGYEELQPFMLGHPPDDRDAVEAVAGLRGWVEETFGVEVPQEWRSVGDDEFSRWLDTQLGHEDPEPERASTAVHEPVMTGEVRVLLQLLGEKDGPDVASRVAEVTGAALGESLRGSTRQLREVGLEVASDRHGIRTIWITVQGATPFTRVTARVAGLEASATLEDARALHGVPEREGESFLRYVVDGRYVHLEFAAGSFSMATLMVDAPEAARRGS